MEQLQWEVRYLEPPKILRHCKKCGKKTEYASSGEFRVNAQQKSLDIWLIYRCTTCKSTWNLTIYSRINPKSIESRLLDKFLANDSELATEYAMNSDLLKRNGAEPQVSPYQIVGDDLDLTKNAELKIVCEHPSSLTVEKILREKLLLTRRELESRVSSGTIRLADGGNIRRAKLKQEVTVLLGTG
jgi:hypothetical protein